MKNCLDCNKLKKSNKGNYCKSCGYKHRIRPSGLKYNIIKNNKGWLKKGHKLGIGKTVSEKTKKILSKQRKGKRVSPKTEFKKGNKPWNIGIEYMRDEKHPNWKGDKVGYLALHSWIARKLGTHKLCNRCGTKDSKRFSWHNISKNYLRDFNDWERLCSKCHAHEHKNWRSRWHIVS